MGVLLGFKFTTSMTDQILPSRSDKISRINFTAVGVIAPIGCIIVNNLNRFGRSSPIRLYQFVL